MKASIFTALCRARHTLFVLLLGTMIQSTAYGQTAYYTNSQNANTQLQTWYNSSQGTYSNGWWNTADAITLLSYYERLTGDNSLYSSVISNTYSVAPGAHNFPNFENDYDDDMGEWGLAWMNAYDLTGNSSYLSKAETIQAYMAANGWDTGTCGGGLWWNIKTKGANAKGGHSDTEFIELSAKLANRTSGSTSAGYLNWANTDWNWLNGTGIINSSNLIDNSLSFTCAPQNNAIWTYNQGFLMGALVELARANNDPSLVQKAEATANAVLNPANGLVNSNGILLEPAGLDANSAMYKGIFARYLLTLYQIDHNPAYMTFLQNNANSIWANDRSGNSIGFYWAGPFDSADASRQTSGMGGIVGALGAQGQAYVGPDQINTYGAQELYVYDANGTVYHNWQNQNVHGASGPTTFVGWHSFTMGGNAASGGPAVTEDVWRYQYVFMPTSGDVFVMNQTPSWSWSSWADMGTSSNGLSDLRAVNTVFGGIYVFGRDSSGTIFYASLANPNASWSSFTALGGESIEPGYVVGVNATSGHLEVFGADSAGNVWHSWQNSNGTWHSWYQITGATLQGTLAIVRNTDGTLQIFGIDTSNTDVWTNWQSTPGGAWQSSWTNLNNVGGGVTIQPGLVCGLNANGTDELFGVGSNGTTYHIWGGHGSWRSSWASMGGTLDPHLVASTTVDGRLQIFGVSPSDHNIYSNWQTSPSGDWNGWASLNGNGYKFYTNQP